MKLLKIGITGGIGCGKSTVCRIFEVLGVPVYYADRRARDLVEQAPELIQGYKNLIGEEAYLPSGRLNRSFVAARIFSDPSLLQEINRLVHPVVQQDFLRWAHHSNAELVLEEAAVLLEGGGQHHFDRIILVTAPESIRIKRVVQRDRVTPEMVKKRMSSQWSDSQRLPFAHFTVCNDDQSLVIPQVLTIYNDLVNSSR